MVRKIWSVAFVLFLSACASKPDKPKPTIKFYKYDSIRKSFIHDLESNDVKDPEKMDGAICTSQKHFKQLARGMALCSILANEIEDKVQ